MNASSFWIFRFSGIVLVIFCLCSCSKESDSQGRSMRKHLTQTDAVLLQHTKRIDIPVPVGFKPQTHRMHHNNSAQEKTCSLCYAGNLTVDQSIAFYKQAMELEGWEIQDFSTEQEGLLFCNKVNKQCALSVRPSPKSSPYKTNLCIFTHMPLQRHATNEQRELHEQIDTINTKTIDL